MGILLKKPIEEFKKLINIIEKKDNNIKLKEINLKEENNDNGINIKKINNKEYILDNGEHEIIKKSQDLSINKYSNINRCNQ